MSSRKYLFYFIIISFFIAPQFNSQTNDNSVAKILVEVNKPAHSISPTLWGIFFEDINLSADGGIYPELVRNRSFEDADTIENWLFSSEDGKSKASLSIADVQAQPPIPPLNPFNRKSIKIEVDGSFKLENGGYWGMNLIEGESYTFKLSARTPNGYNSPLEIKIIEKENEVLASGIISDFNQEWQNISVNLKSSGSNPKAFLEISGKGKGTLYLDMISLMPDNTYKNHGLRADLAEALDSLNPTFFRFPGGCWVEGDDFEHMNHWKHTIGSVETRTPLWNIWDYNATNGLGYHEYLQFAEDLGAEPLYCINAGISHKEVIPMDQMGQWIQDALDAIEYANGPVTSVWGGLRAKNGHPEPFYMKYLEIGNENGGDNYNERWKIIADAVHAKYPDMILIANDWFQGHPSDPKPEIIDEHYYNNPDWFILNSHKYDNYDRKGPKIFVGEYAVTSQSGNGNLRGAIGEAAWMIGMERNSDIVTMAAYAPLFCNSNHKRWPINLINFDSHRWYGLPSYYVQKMFADNSGSKLLPVKVENVATIEAPFSSGCVGLGTWNNSAEFKDFKVVSPDGKVLYETDFSNGIEEWTKTNNGEWSFEDGVLRQSATVPNVTAFVGDTSWTDYTISLKARKIYGENGFQIYFRNNHLGQRNRWDIGGYWNAVYLLDVGATSHSISAGVEPGKWYDIKIELNGSSVKGYLDGKLISEVGGEKASAKALIASSSIDE
ncbi:MAG: hypothetical protein OQJ81_06905, partial [Melioribacteraceae bacterium]|nr:hypothetical protein [Melioribacteraceae bacterium]